jgi:hypothetical protein
MYGSLTADKAERVWWCAQRTAMQIVSKLLIKTLNLQKKMEIKLQTLITMLAFFARKKMLSK